MNLSMVYVVYVKNYLDKKKKKCGYAMPKLAKYIRCIHYINKQKSPNTKHLTSEFQKVRVEVSRNFPDISLPKHYMIHSFLAFFCCFLWIS